MDPSDPASKMYRTISFYHAELHLSESKLFSLIVGHGIYVGKTKLVNWKLLHWELSSPKFKMRPHILHTEICQWMFTQRIARNFKFPSWLISMNSSAFDQKIYRLQNLCHLDTFRGLGLSVEVFRMKMCWSRALNSTGQSRAKGRFSISSKARQWFWNWTELNWIGLPLCW